MDTDKSKSVIYPLFATPIMVCGDQYNTNVDELNYIKSLNNVHHDHSFITPGNENRRTTNSNILESFELSTVKQFCLKFMFMNFYLLQKVQNFILLNLGVIIILLGTFTERIRILIV